jgi:hypothetical protein
MFQREFSRAVLVNSIPSSSCIVSSVEAAVVPPPAAFYSLDHYGALAIDGSLTDHGTLDLHG